MNKFCLVSLLVLCVFSITLKAQKTFLVDGTSSKDFVDKSFNNKLFQDVLLYKINHHMDSLGLEGYEAHEFFMAPAKEHALIMADEGEASLEGRGSYSTVRDRLIAAGGSGVGGEVVSKQNMRGITYEALADQVLSRWLSGKNTRTLFSQKYFFAGVAGAPDKENKKIFISMYVGNYTSFIPTGNFTNELAVATTTKAYGLKHFDEKICTKVKRKMPNLVDLQQGLSISEDGNIIFEYKDLKRLKRLLKNSTDGLAVDIIQKSQFTNNDKNNNLVNYSLVNYGYMTKRLLSNALFKKNLAEPDMSMRRPKVRSLKVVLSELPVEFKPEDIELNLIFIKDKNVCANISQSWVDKKILDLVPRLTLLPDTLEIDHKSKYAPISSSTELKFKIPFEQGKHTYKPEDMGPILKTLNEPAFIINKIFIAAYSSLEGRLADNTALQKKRAQSIVKALEENQNFSIVDSIVTEANLKDLKTDTKGTPYEAVSKMNLNEAINYVNSKAREMESILKKHRYADVIIWVTYDIKGEKEQRYVIEEFNKAVEAKKLDYALKIQKYILKRVVEGRYSGSALSDMKIPQGKEYVGLNMNKIWLMQFVNMDVLDEDYLEKVDDLHKLDDKNIYVEYNDILCEVLVTDVTKDNNNENLQLRINKLYNTPINVDLVDILNIELQYQVMDIYRDSLGDEHPMVAKSLEKIKEIIKFDKLDWRNSLKLASIFIHHSDYAFALSLLEPWVNQDLPFIFTSTYVTLCSKVDSKIHSNRFVKNLEKIKNQDKKFFCDLFSGDKLSIQTFANTRVKAMYLENCKK